jgi:3-phytase
MARWFFALPVLLAGCTVASPNTITATPTAAVAVTARAETVPVGRPNEDAADDPAIWRNPRNPSQSLIVATDKKAGLYVYGLDGRVRHFDAAGRLNNVDLIDLGSAGVLVAASDRNDPANARLRLYRLNTMTGALTAAGSVTGGSGEAYGVCLWRDRGRLYAFSVLKEGNVHQVELIAGGRQGGRIVRTMKLATQPEGCVVDPRTARLFVGEEDRGIWSFDARASGATTGSLAIPADGVQLVADVEGLAIAPQGRRGGFLIASSQGDDSYALFRLPDLRPAGRFKIVQGTFGSTEETDGIAFHPGSFGQGYTNGLFVAQDGSNGADGQNFKIVSWTDVLTALGR